MPESSPATGKNPLTNPVLNPKNPFARMGAPAGSQFTKSIKTKVFKKNKLLKGKRKLKVRKSAKKTIPDNLF